MLQQWRDFEPGSFGSWLVFLIGCGIILLVVLAVRLALRLAFRRIGGDHHWATLLRERLRRPISTVIILILLWINLEVVLVPPDWRWLVERIFVIAVILSLTWLIGSVLTYLLDITLTRFTTSESDGWRARQARTQVAIVRRLVVAVMVILGVGAALLTFPGVRGVGATVLASAGVVSVVLGLAAQSTLGNVFAGVQLAFSGALRLDDTVVVDGAWGYVEEITLTYVVVKVWDERRLMVPTTFFTQRTYENWTRKGRSILHPFYFDLDWGVDIAAMRARLDEILADTSRWDGQFRSLRVYDQTGGYVRVRVLLSAANSEVVWDLERYVREELLIWLQQENPEGLPRTRIQQVARDGETLAAGYAARPDSEDFPTVSRTPPSD